MTEAATQDQTPVATKEAWGRARVHQITLPSGFQVKIVIPDLPALIKAGQFPNQMVEQAIGVAQGRKATREDIELQADFYNTIAAITVVEPEVSVEDFGLGEDGRPKIPFEDKEMVVEFATRQRDIDATYHHLGGLETVQSFRAARGMAEPV